MKPARPPAKRTEEPLYRQAARGSEEALARLYEEHVDGLHAFVFYRVGGDKSLAEDVVQETFLKAIDELSAYDPGRGSFMSWLCVVSRNVMRSHLRAYRRTEELKAMWDRIDRTLAQVFAALDSAPLSDEVLAREETRDLVNMTIAHLPDHYREVLERRYMAGESVSELGARLSVSEEAAKSLLARARRAFREAFQTLSQAMAEAK
jgi:RNA polymerase sigma-70 factor, ECF subfamily